MGTISVITPTIGRQSLSATIASVLPELARGDELVVVADGAHGPHGYAHGLVTLAQDETAGTVKYLETTVEGSRFGNGQRDAGLRHAAGTHVCFLDDDDVWREGAGDLFREAAEDSPRAVHVFRAVWGPGHHWHGVLWQERAFVEGNVGTPMCVWPNRDLPAWMGFNDRGVVSDFGWMGAALGVRRVEWHDHLVATVRP